jgi:hypothetical protein
MPVINFDVPQIDGTFLPDGEYSDVVDTQALKPWKTIHYYIETTATLQLQGSVDGSHWVAIGSNVTSSSLVTIVEPLTFMRVYVVGNAAGDTSVYMTAHDPSGS